MPPAEPTPADVAAVSTAMGGQPAPQPTQPEPQPTPQPAQPTQPAPQQQPSQPTSQPSPTSQPLDPFAAFAAPTPQTEPTPTPQPQPPAEPSQPAPEPQAAPQQPEPAEPPQPEAQPERYQSFEEYMKSVGGDAPAPTSELDPSKINPDDPEAIKGFFDEVVNTAVQRATQVAQRQTALQAREKSLWDASFEKYPSLKSNKNLRDMVHSIRMGYFQRNIAITPTQAADKLLESLGQQYRQGVADNQVHTTIEQVQPTGGGTGQPVTTTADAQQAMIAVQEGGEEALTQLLDQEIRAGRL